MKKTRRTAVTRLDDVPRFFLSELAVKNLTGRGQMAGLSVVHVKLPPRYSHPPIVHRKTEEWFLVLDGRGHGLIGSRRVEFRPGRVVYMPAGVPHAMSTGAGPLEILAVFSPPLDARKKNADICAAP